MMYGFYGPGMGWWMVLSSLFWLVLVAVAVWALVRFLSQPAHSSARHNATDLSSGPSAEEILRQRYARGEIDADTFHRMRAELERTAERDSALPGSQR